MIRYYKLFDLLNRRNMKKSNLREILSSKTIAKLSKGEYISGEVIEKICIYLDCQPGDIMEVVEMEKIQNSDNDYITYKNIRDEEYDNAPIKEIYIENIPRDKTIAESDINNEANRQIIDRSDWNN